MILGPYPPMWQDPQWPPVLILISDIEISHYNRIAPKLLSVNRVFCLMQVISPGSHSMNIYHIYSM